MSTTASPSTPHRSRSAEIDGSLQLVSFKLADEEYGIEIRKVQEIILVGEITQLPQLPTYVKGVINLRNHMIPIVDLKRQFGFPDSGLTEETRIMVINIQDRTIGIIVDAVSEVLRISKEQITPPPPMVAGLGKTYLVGLARLSDRLLILLDIEKTLGDEGELLEQQIEASLHPAN